METATSRSLSGSTGTSGTGHLPHDGAVLVVQDHRALRAHRSPADILQRRDDLGLFLRADLKIRQLDGGRRMSGRTGLRNVHVDERRDPAPDGHLFRANGAVGLVGREIKQQARAVAGRLNSPAAPSAVKRTVPC